MDELCEEVPYWPRSIEDRISCRHVFRTTTENEEDNINDWFSSLIQRGFISLSLSKVVDSVHTLFLSFRQL